MPGNNNSWLKPDRLDWDTSAPDAGPRFTHWLKTLVNFIATLDGTNNLAVLTNFVGHHAYQLIESETTYDGAITVLKSSYLKQENPIYSRHLLSTRKQLPEETLDEFLLNLKTLAKPCQFTAVSAVVHQEEAIRDAFITGLRSHYIRQRLLENEALDLQTAFANARTLAVAQKNSENYASPSCSAVNPQSTDYNPRYQENPPEKYVALTRSGKPPWPPNKPPPWSQNKPNYSSTCYFCGKSPKHPRNRCPASEATCYKCQKKGHFSKVCKGNPAPSDKFVAATGEFSPQSPPSSPKHGGSSSYPPCWSIMSTQTVPHTINKSMTDILINEKPVQAVADSASTYSFMHPACADSLKLKVYPAREKISMASKSLTTEATGYCIVQL